MRNQTETNKNIDELNIFIKETKITNYFFIFIIISIIVFLAYEIL